MSSENTLTLLTRLYSERGFPSGTKFYQYLKTLPEFYREKWFTNKFVQNFVNSQDTQQVFQKQNEIGRFVYPIRAFYPFQRVMIDLMDVRNEFYKQNDHTPYLFCAVDVYTRYAFVYPMKSKTEQETKRCILELLKNIEKVKKEFQGKDYVGYMPNSLELISDNEAALTGNLITTLCKKLFIEQTFVMHDFKRKGIVERFIRTLRNYIRKYEHANDTSIWINELQHIISTYNDSYHSTLRTTPNRALYDNSKYETAIQKRIGKLDCMQNINPECAEEYGLNYKSRVHNHKPTLRTTKATKINVGDFVRVLRRKPLIGDDTKVRREKQIRKFAKESQTWSSSVHKVLEIHNYQYRVQGINTWFRRSELQLVNSQEHDINEGKDFVNNDLGEERVNPDGLIGLEINDGIPATFDLERERQLEARLQRNSHSARRAVGLSDSYYPNAEEKFQENLSRERNQRIRRPNRSNDPENLAAAQLVAARRPIAGGKLRVGIYRKWLRSLFNPY